MDFALSSEQKMLRESIAKFASSELNSNVVERDRSQEFSRDLWCQAADFGLLGLPVPVEYGGTNSPPLDCAIAFEALGYGCRDGGLVFSICAHVLACVVPICKHGNEAQKQKYLEGLSDGTLVGAHAITEPDAGSDAFSMRLQAKSVEGGWLLNGTKTFISNGPIADVVLVFAVTDREKGFHGGITAFLVERGTEGYSAGQKFTKMGLRTSPVGELVFEDAFLSNDAVLGAVGGGNVVFATAMDWERALLVAAHVGTMERLLETSIAYARTRSQFGQPIGKFQGVAHKLADMKVQLEAARLLVYRTASTLEVSRSISLDSAITKLFVSESLVRAALDTVQLHGGNGFMEEYEVERALRDAIGATIYSGTSEMQRNIIARWLGL